MRRSSAPATKTLDYRTFREHVREDFRKTCAYCLLEETWAAGPEYFELDHFQPKSLFPLCTFTFVKHFVEQKNGKWRGKTLSAKYTIDSLRLNRPHLIELRVLLRDLALE